ncbi:MAG: DNA polymerase III subunit alpha [Anaerolineae bacterium]|nr:DNA polymerase III subunit alpha [Anaerolineae bacterium]
MPEFVHLHTHTEFSLLDGLSSPKVLAHQAHELGMEALAITDHGVMFGVVDFYKACQDVGIKPIIGIEAYVARTSRFSRAREDGKPYHIVLLAQNQTGYQNLLKLASSAQLEGFYYKPRIDKEVLAQHSEGVIVLTACAQGEIPQLVHHGQLEQAREAARWYQERFPGRFYIELQTHEIPEFDAMYRQLVTLAREMDVPLVATNDIHYARRDQAEAHDVLLCIGTGKTVNDPHRLRMSDPSYYMRSPNEMWALYQEIPEALENTVKIAEQCHVEIQFAPPYHLPTFPAPAGQGSAKDYLYHLCDQGMSRRYGPKANDPGYRERLDYELGIIDEMGFNDYFLIVWDLCRAAEERDIWWNVRGSGAGSVVAYTLGITNVDPFKNRLMFERFLNPARINMPDIDLDYPDDRRDELIAYTVERYGADHVSQIITFGTLGARAAIRDVGRAMDIPLNEVDKVARLIPNMPGKPVSISQALEQVPELKETYDSTPYIQKLLDTARQVEGVARHASTHAAGVLISDRPLVEYLPLHRPTRGGGESPLGSISQWPMEIVDEMGMLKVDFLGLRTLTHMRKTCELIEQETGRKLNLTTIPYERTPDAPERDADVKALYDLLSSGETTGVFQVEGNGMRRTLRELRPFEFQHIIAAIALYRPGPMENIPSYIRRLHQQEAVTYRHPILEELLGDTYGIIVYQEQIMQVAVALAGYKPGEADMIRKAVAKKKQKLMDYHKQHFTEGAVAQNIETEVAEAVWGDIEFFARYGFNRAHATDYAVITAQTAYLKAHYPLEFMTALMTTERHNIEKLGFLITDARRTGISVVGPSINRSEVEFTIERDAAGKQFIRIGLSAIKNVGEDAVGLIVAARREGGRFKSLDDFADRVDLRKLNRRALECLVQAGALDEFGPRPALMTLLDTMMSASSHVHGARDVGQFTLFDALGTTATQIKVPEFYPPIPNRTLLEWEKDLLGTYLAEHPLEQQERELLSKGIVNTSIAGVASEALGQQLTLVGMVQRARRITTKKGETMAFVTLEGPGGTVDVIAFPRTYERSKHLLLPERIVVVSGKLDMRPDREEQSVLADWFKDPNELLQPDDAPPPGTDGDPGFPFMHDPPSPYEHVAEPEPAALPSRPATATPRQQTRAEASPQALPQATPHLTPEEPPEVFPAGPVAPPSRQSMPAPPLPPEEPPSPPAILCVTLRRTQNHTRDYQQLAQLHQMLAQQEGDDSFIFILKNGAEQGPERVELEFPNEHIRITPDLRKQVETLVGRENVRIIVNAA